MFPFKSAYRLKCIAKIWKHRFVSFSSGNEIRVEKLKQRTVLKLSGKDTANYLQSMITNDIKRVETSPSWYSLLLNAQGRVLYDIILYKICDNEYLVEYDATAVEYLHRHLLMYRLRKDVKIEPMYNLTPWVLYKEDQCDAESLQLRFLHNHFKTEDVLSSIDDPRNGCLGVRVITKKDIDLHKLLKSCDVQCTKGDSYRILRYKLGIGEGVQDHPTGNCLPFETNVDFLNGVSFTKGCYIGQELTARAHFVLNVRKRLMPITLQKMDDYPTFPIECDIVNGKKHRVGRLRSHVGEHGLALLKYEDCMKSDSLQLQGYDVSLKVVWPKWWPNNLNATT